MSCPIAREGRGYVAGALAAAAGFLMIRNRAARGAAFAALGTAGALAWFFRDPERHVLPIENGILAPADGRVIRIDTAELPEVFDAPVRRISIFMNLHNCHVNRAPVSGTVVYKKRDEGGFLAAWEDRASEENRRVTLGIEGRPRCAMRQVSGLVARQIVTRPEVGETVEQGERVGMIKFGSRVDVFFPLESRLMVNIGDLTIAGVTALAEMKSAEGGEDRP